MGRIHAAQQLEAERHVTQDLIRQFADVARLQPRKAQREHADAGQRRQVTHAVQAVEQQHQRAAFVLRRRLAPAVDGTQESARAQVALTRMATGRPVDDRAHGIVDRMWRRPWQPQDVAPMRVQALDHACGVGLVERRLPREQVVQQHAKRQHIAFGGQAACAQGPGVRFLRSVGRRGPRAWRFGGGRADVERRHAQRALLVHEQMLQLQIVMHHASLVRESQPFECLPQHCGHRVRRGFRIRVEPFSQRLAERALHGHEGPVILHADLDHGGQMRVVEARRHACVTQPGFERVGMDRRHAGHAEHQLALHARVERQPAHRGVAPAQQTTQFEASERARRVGLGVSGDGSDHGARAGSTKRGPCHWTAAPPRRMRRTGAAKQPSLRCPQAASISTSSPAPVTKAQCTTSPGCSTRTASR